MKIIVSTFVFLLSFNCFSGELNVSANALIKRGNVSLTQYGINSNFIKNNFNGSVLSELYSDKIDKFWKHEVFLQYEYVLNKKWSLLASGMAGQDLKKKINFQHRELIGLMYEIASWLKYDLGLGNKSTDGDNHFLVSHHLDMKKEFSLFEIYGQFWFYHWKNNREIDSTLGSRYKISERFKFGFSFNYNRTTDYSDGVNPWDLSNKLEIVYSI